MAHGTCSIDGCDTVGTLVRGWCPKHYSRYKRHGDPEHTKTIWGDDVRRFHSKIATTDAGCWHWTGTRNGNGYGQIKVQGVMWQAHRYSYLLRHGAIPDGAAVDHLCRNRGCVNPDHLEAVDVRTNTLRGEGVTAQNARRQTCAHGHTLTDRHDGLGRYCPTCHREGDRLRKHAKRATSGGPNV